MKNAIAKQRHVNMLETAFGEDIMQFLQDPSIIEIMLNPDGHIFIDQLAAGKSPTSLFLPPEQALNIVKLVASYKNYEIHEKTPMVATEIPFFGARFQGWLPPVVKAASFAIRKRATHIFTLDDYVEKGTLSARQAESLKEAVLGRKNILIVGGTGSGKTTFSNALLDVLKGTNDRILILEDLPELQLMADDVVTMNTTDSVSMRDLVRGSLRMRPDRIIIGEVRDGAALELLKAWNTGHPGGISTLHANSVETTPHRLEDLIREVVAVPPHYLIPEALDLIVFIERDKSGQRKIKSLAKLTGYFDNQYHFEFV